MHGNRMTVNPLDAAVALVALASMALGAWRGFLYELVSMAGWVLAFVVARWGAADLAPALPMQGASAELRLVVAFVALFIAVAFLAGLVSWLVRRLARASAIRPVDRTLGLVFGLTRAGLVVTLLGVVATLTPLGRQPFWVDSMAGDGLLWLGRQVLAWLPQDMGKVLN